MSSRALMQTLVDLLTFLALSDDEIVDPDTAVEQLEHAAATLRQLPEDERREFLAFVVQAAARAATQQDAGRAEFLSALPAQLGLAE